MHPRFDGSAAYNLIRFVSLVKLSSSGDKSFPEEVESTCMVLATLVVFNIGICHDL